MLRLTIMPIFSKTALRLQLLLTLFALVCLATSCAPGVARRQRIDSCMGDCVETYRFEVGREEIVLETKALVSGDNGSAEIIITHNGAQLDRLVGSFDYDMWSDEPIGYATRRWVDDDSCLDLLIVLEENGETTDRYVITCATLQVMRLAPE